MQKGLEAVLVTVELPNVLIVNILEWNLFVVIVYRPPSNETMKQVYCKPSIKGNFYEVTS